MFDSDGASSSMLIDDVEFMTAMRNQFGYRGSKSVLDSVFQSLDLDGSGFIGFDEVFEFVRGRRHSLDERNKRMRTLTLEPPKGAQYTLDEIKWDVDTLRIMLNLALDRANAGPNDLFQAWDKSGDNKISRPEIHFHIRSFFKDFHPDLWESEVLHVVEGAFVGMQGKYDRNQTYVDIVELVSWLEHKNERSQSGKIHLKTVKALRKQAERRQPKAKAVHVKRVDVQMLQQQGIAKAAAAFASKTALAAEGESEHELEWTRSRQSQFGGQRFEIPPLQRWEMPKRLDVSLPPIQTGIVASPRRSPTRESSPRLSSPFARPMPSPRQAMEHSDSLGSLSGYSRSPRKSLVLTRPSRM